MMRASSLLVFSAGLLWAMAAGAQLYKSISPDGKVTYSDTPPASAAHIERKPYLLSEPGDALAPELSLALKKNPVTLYTADNCKPCDEGRALLKQRGIPFAERTVKTNDDIAALRRAGGDQQLPLLTIGGHQQQGFEAGAWHAGLTAAGYPATSKLPKTYQPPSPQAAAPAPPGIEQKTVPAAPAPADTDKRRSAAPTGASPPGFRF